MQHTSLRTTIFFVILLHPVYTASHCKCKGIEDFLAGQLQVLSEQTSLYLAPCSLSLEEIFDGLVRESGGRLDGGDSGWIFCGSDRT